MSNCFRYQSNYPGMMILLINYLVESRHQISATSRKESRELMPKCIYGMTHCCLEEGHIRSSEDEQGRIIDKCHASPYGGHFVGDITAQKIL